MISVFGLILLCRWPRTLVACARWRIANFAASPESDAQSRLLLVEQLFTLWSCRGLITVTLFYTSPVATPICSIVNLVAVRSVLFFDMEVIIWVYRCFFSLVARTATLGNSWNLHKSNMATMDSGFASGWDIIHNTLCKINT